MDTNSAVRPTPEIIEKINMIDAGQKTLRAELIKSGVDLWVTAINKYLQAGVYDLHNGKMRIAVPNVDIRVYETVVSIVKTIFNEAGWDVEYSVELGKGSLFFLSVRQPEPEPLSFWEIIRGKWR